MPRSDPYGAGILSVVPEPRDRGEMPEPRDRGVVPEPRDRGAERAERLARLRAVGPGQGARVPPNTEIEAETAPEIEPGSGAGIAPAGSEPEAEPGGDLDRLPGIGPGLIRALRRAGFSDLEAVAAADPAGLKAALGPLGALVPAGAWVAVARGIVAPSGV